MAMNKMIDVRVEAEAMLLALSCATFYVKNKTTDPVMMDVAKKIKGVTGEVGTACWEQICEYGGKCGECDTAGRGADCPGGRREEAAESDEGTSN